MTSKQQTSPVWWVATTSVLAVLLLGLGGFQLTQARGGVDRVSTEVAGVPVTVLTPPTGRAAPGLIVAHGFAGSAALMDGLATSWARAGFSVAVLDFTGHGSNPKTLQIDSDNGTDRSDLLADLDAVASWFSEQPYVTDQPLSLVGHSMGAGAVVSAAVADAQSPRLRYGATVALSLPSAEEIPVGEVSVPANLLLLWGAAEQERFRTAALDGLRAAYPDGVAGQSYGDFADGSARAAREVPGAEHISILWRGDTTQWTYDWLAEAVGLPAGTIDRDQRMPWVAAIYLGALFSVVPLATALLGNVRPTIGRTVGGGRAVLIMLAAAVAASLAAAIARPATQLLPLAVGGHLAFWFAAGAVVLSLLGSVSARGPAQPVKLARALVAGLLISLWLALALALVGRLSWAPMALVGQRPLLVLLFGGILLAWFAGDELLVRRSSRIKRLGLMVVSRLILVAALLAGVFFLGAPGFLILLLPLMVPLLLLLGSAAWIVAGRTGSVLAPALVQALPLALLIGTTFPLVST